MRLIEWNNMPKEIKNKNVKEYYDYLLKKELHIRLKRKIDFIMAVIISVMIFPIILFIVLLIKFDSNGPIFFTQNRVTQYNKKFKIYKFRTMYTKIENGEDFKITCKGDVRVTKIGKYLRKLKIDEIPQLINVLKGEMSFVGVRPEIEEFVNEYSEEMYATLLLPAGITSEASIKFKDEEELINRSDNPHKMYIEKIMLEKMYYNLESLKKFSLFNDFKILFKTIINVYGLLIKN